jgi:hypothetical protein
MCPAAWPAQRQTAAGVFAIFGFLSGHPHSPQRCSATANGRRRGRINLIFSAHAGQGYIF